MFRLFECGLPFPSDEEFVGEARKTALKIIYGFDVSYSTALTCSGLDRLDVPRSTLREKFVYKVGGCYELSDP